MPFAGYDDFEACERANSDKRDPGAYCAAIKRATEQLEADVTEVESVADLAPQLDVQADGPCWDGYVMVGTKTENGREVPNCVPEEDADEMREQAATDPERAASQYRATVQTLDMLAHTSPEWQRFGGDWGIGWVHSESGELVYQQDSYTDYPEAAKENAQMALDAIEDTGNPNDCLTRVGMARANQLADGEPVSRDTVGRMAAFERHEDNKEMSDEEGRADCGWLGWRAWGGDEGIEWAQDKLDELEDDTEEQLDGGFAADVFQIVQRDDDGPLSDGDLLGIGVDMPNAGVYVDWNIDAWPDDEQLEEPHVSDYGTVADLENATGGSVEVIETVAPDGETLNQQSRVAGQSVLVNGLSGEARQSISEKYNVEIRDADE